MLEEMKIRYLYHILRCLYILFNIVTILIELESTCLCECSPQPL